MLVGLDTIRPIRCDEAWYSNTGFNFSLGHGFENDITFKGSNSNLALPFLLGCSFKLFGFSLYTARLVSVFSGLFFLIAFRRIMEYYSLSLKYQIIGFVSFLSISFFYSVFSYARPEGLALAFLAFGIYYLILFTDTRKYKYFSLMAVELYLSFMSHPYMSIYFLAFGIYLTYISFAEKDIKLFYHLFLLLLAAVLAIYTTVIAHCYYNYHSLDIINATIDVFNRTSLRSVKSDLLSDRIGIFVEQYIFSSRVIFSVPLFIVVVFGLFLENKMIKVLSVFSVSHFILSFFIFKNDLGMFPTTHTYFIAVSIIILPFVLSEYQLTRWVAITVVTFILLNFSASIFYNSTRRENVNSQLSNDLKRFIPDKSYVYGPIECWFFLPNTHYKSNMYKEKLDFSKFNYVILRNTEAGALFSTYTKVYKSNSSQYGDISVYKKQ
jgi:hypothetical protein